MPGKIVIVGTMGTSNIATGRTIFADGGRVMHYGLSQKLTTGVKNA